MGIIWSDLISVPGHSRERERYTKYTLILARFIEDTQGKNWEQLKEQLE